MKYQLNSIATLAKLHARIPQDKNPSNGTTLVLHINAFDESFGFSVREKDWLVKFTTEELHKIMDIKHNIQNMYVISHVDHGIRL